MKKIALFCLMMALSITSYAQTKNFIDQPYLETTAKVDTLVIPDIIYMDIVLREIDNKNKISVEQLENKMASKLKGLGIDLKEQLKLADVSSNFKKYFLRQKNVVKSKAFKLKVYDGITAGKVIQELEKAGISNVSLSQMEYSKIEDLRLHLKSKAVAKAKRQAEFLTKPLNQKVGGALHISDTYYQNFRQKRGMNEVMMMSMDKGEASEPLNVEFNPIQVTSEVSIKFKIE